MSGPWVLSDGCLILIFVFCPRIALIRACRKLNLVAPERAPSPTFMWRARAEPRVDARDPAGGLSSIWIQIFGSRRMTKATISLKQLTVNTANKLPAKNLDPLAGPGFRTVPSTSGDGVIYGGGGGRQFDIPPISFGLPFRPKRSFLVGCVRGRA